MTDHRELLRACLECLNNEWDHDCPPSECKVCPLINRIEAALAEPAPDVQCNRRPTIDECRAAGERAGLPDTPDERERFEAYIRGHCWYVGPYDHASSAYFNVHVRCLYGVWRDCGKLLTTADATPRTVAAPEPARHTAPRPEADSE